MRVKNFSNFTYQTSLAKSENSNTVPMNFKSINLKSNCRQLPSFCGYKPLLNSLNAIKLAEAFQKDYEYRAMLAAGIGNVNPASLKSVVGKNELIYLLKNKFERQNFFPGPDKINVKNRIFCVNMHNHTVFSDGLMTPFQLMEKAFDLVKEVKKTVYIALTDHNGVEGNKSVLKLISKNPERYEDVRFIPGMEIFSNHMPPNAPEGVKSTHHETLVYCVNPFDEDIKKLLDGKTYKETSGHIPSMSIPLQSIMSCFADKPALKILAHPGRVKLSPSSDMQQFLQDFIKMGGEGIEAHYTYLEGKHFKKGTQHEDAIDFAEKNSLVKTGGRDSHTHNIYYKFN